MLVNPQQCKIVEDLFRCTSAAFPTPMRGYDLFPLDGEGKVERLEIVVTDAPAVLRGQSARTAATGSFCVARRAGP